MRTLLLCTLVACGGTIKGKSAGTDSGTADTTDPGTTDIGSTSEILAGQLVISEIMQDPLAVDGDFGEYIEVTNMSGLPLDLIGLTLTDDDDTGFTITRSLPIAVDGQVLFGPSADLGANGGLPVDYAYSVGGIKLGNSKDTLSIFSGPRLIDAVTYDPLAGWPYEEGRSMSLGTLDADANDLPQNWCLATSSFGPADDLGTPGEPNDPC